LLWKKKNKERFFGLVLTPSGASSPPIQAVRLCFPSSPSQQWCSKSLPEIRLNEIGLERDDLKYQKSLNL